MAVAFYVPFWVRGGCKVRGASLCACACAGFVDAFSFETATLCIIWDVIALAR